MTERSAMPVAAANKVFPDFEPQVKIDISYPIPISTAVTCLIRQIIRLQFLTLPPHRSRRFQRPPPVESAERRSLTDAFSLSGGEFPEPLARGHAPLPRACLHEGTDEDHTAEHWS